MGPEWIVIPLNGLCITNNLYKILIIQKIEFCFHGFSYALGPEGHEHDILKLVSDTIFGISVWKYSSGKSTEQGPVEQNARKVNALLSYCSSPMLTIT